MDYVVGNVAALIAGNVTPNRPKLSKRALTPIKHMPSPNVTPKSELVDDRSIFLSPSVQKKKAIVKKSPKRIFQNPDLDVTNEREGNTSTTSPKADKVKKHLKGELDATVSPKNNSKAAETSEKQESPKKKAVNSDMNNSIGDNVNPNELTPKKNKKKRNSITENSQSVTESIKTNQSEGTPKKNKKKRNSTSEVGQNVAESPKKNKTQNKENVQNDTATNKDAETVKSPKKKKKNKKKPQNTEVEKSENTVNNVNTAEGSQPNETEDIQPKETKATNPKKKNKKRKHQQTNENSEENDGKPTKTKKIKVNPNAITDKDSDSEHESDNEIESETEESNKEVLEKSAEPEEASSDEEDTPTPKKKEKETGKVREVNTEDEIKRTLFVGNVPFSKKCKKEIKKIFSKYGQIESVRIRTVPVKDPSVTPKLAVIKQELHPERSTVNVYVKFTNPQCVDQALAENNTVLNNNHLRVTRSGSTGAEHDPRHSVFVGNIPFALEDEGLREKFEKCGEIESVRIVRDKKTNAGKGFGYVNFTSKDGVELALALTDEDLTIKNRIMRVKRCTQATQRQAQKGNNRPGFQGKKLSQGDRQRNQAPGKFNQGRNQGFQGNRGGNFQNRGGNLQNKSGNFQKKGGNFQNKGGNFQNKGGNFQGRGGNFGKQNDGEKVGAERRLMNKRKSQEGGNGPRDDQPREKKPRKEFVGMTAEKKKKRKFDKGQKKKKALSEILTK